MQLLRTSFNLRSDLRWSEDVYRQCIFAWIFGSENKKSKVKNYAALLRVLPRSIDIAKQPNNRYSFAGESLEYESFSLDGVDYLGFLFSCNNLGRIWKTRIAFRRTSKHVQCFVSLDCDLVKGSWIPKISKPKILDYLIRFQDGDGNIDISDKPHIIDYSDINSATVALKGKKGNVLPIVYLSCSERTHSLKPSEVAKQLFGVAHVFAEKDKTIYSRLKIDMKDTPFPKGGEIGICYNNQPIDIFNRYSVVDWQENPETLVQDIFIKILRKNLALKFNFTWDDFLEAQSRFKAEEAERERIAQIKSVELLRSELNNSRATKEEQSRKIEQLMAELEKVTKERDQYKDEHARFDTLQKQYNNVSEERSTWERLALESDEKLQKTQEELSKTKEELHEQNVKNDALQQNFELAYTKNVQYLPLRAPKEQPMFPEEFKCQLISILNLAYKNVRVTDISPEVRTKVFIEQILEANEEAVKVYEDFNKKRDALEKVAKAQNIGSSDGSKVMKPFQMEIIKKGNNHGKIKFINDEKERFLGSESSTPGETSRGGKNQASDLLKAMLWSV